MAKTKSASKSQARARYIGGAFKAAFSKRAVPENGPLISIVMPAYNDEAFVGRAVLSCLSQTYENIELVCVDDASTDGTLAELRKLAESDADGRVKVIALEKNSGPHNARLAGVDQATGELITFLDADDELAHDVCSKIAAEYMREPADILHFATHVRRDGRVSVEQALDVTDWTTPVNGVLTGRDILTRSFIDLDYSFSIWGKAYRTELARRAFDAIGPRESDFGEDALEYFAIAYYAKSYRGIPNKRLYVYHLGDGLSARSHLTAEEFERTLRGVHSVEGMREFLESRGEGACDEYADVYQAHRSGQLAAMLRSWMTDVREEDREAVLRRVLELWPLDEVVEGVCALGTPAVEVLRSCLGDDLQLSEEQVYKQGMADGSASTREEYQASGSYRLGRAATAIPRSIRSYLMK